MARHAEDRGSVEALERWMKRRMGDGEWWMKGAGAGKQLRTFNAQRSTFKGGREGKGNDDHVKRDEQRGPLSRQRRASLQFGDSADNGGGERSGAEAGRRVCSIGHSPDVASRRTRLTEFAARHITPRIQPSISATFRSSGSSRGLKNRGREPSVSARRNHAVTEYAACWSPFRSSLGKRRVQSDG